MSNLSQINSDYDELEEEKLLLEYVSQRNVDELIKNANPLTYERVEKELLFYLSRNAKRLKADNNFEISNGKSIDEKTKANKVQFTNWNRGVVQKNDSRDLTRISSNTIANSRSTTNALPENDLQHDVTGISTDTTSDSKNSANVVPQNVLIVDRAKISTDNVCELQNSVKVVHETFVENCSSVSLTESFVDEPVAKNLIRKKLLIKPCYVLLQRCKPNCPYRKTCELCDGEFFTENGYLKHIESHFTCHFCEKMFFTYEQIKRHIIILHLTVKLVFSKTYCSRKIVKSNRDKELPSFILNDKVIGNKKNLRNSFKNCIDNLKCFSRRKTFTSKNSVEKNTLSGEKRKLFKCNSCDKTFTWKSNLNFHQRVHDKLRPYKCNSCDKTFTWKSNLNVHQRVHDKLRPYKCTSCDRTFTQIGNLNVHKQIHIFTSTGNLYVDKQLRDRLRFKCTSCDKGFTSKTNLNIHKRIHDNIRPFKCILCNKTFTAKCHLKVHKRIHDKVRPTYNCTSCDETFTQKRHLVTHKRIHKVRPYKCTFCDQSFTRESLLNYHKGTVHDNVRPYKFTSCDKTFTHKGHLNVHQKLVNVKVRYIFRNNKLVAEKIS